MTVKVLPKRMFRFNGSHMGIWEPEDQKPRLNDFSSLNPFHSTDQPVDFFIGIVERQ
jgi:hypothetical protein